MSRASPGGGKQRGKKEKTLGDEKKLLSIRTKKKLRGKGGRSIGRVDRVRGMIVGERSERIKARRGKLYSGKTAKSN